MRIHVTSCSYLWVCTRNVTMKQFSQLLAYDSKATYEVRRIKERNEFRYNFNPLMHSCCFMNHQIQNCRALQWKLKGKGKRNVHLTTGHGGPETK